MSTVASIKPKKAPIASEQPKAAASSSAAAASSSKKEKKKEKKEKKERKTKKAGKHRPINYAHALRDMGIKDVRPKAALQAGVFVQFGLERVATEVDRWLRYTEEARRTTQRCDVERAFQSLLKDAPRLQQGCLEAIAAKCKKVEEPEKAVAVDKKSSTKKAKSANA